VINLFKSLEPKSPVELPLLVDSLSLIFEIYALHSVLGSDYDVEHEEAESESGGQHL
jgi:hypothetical protein